MSREHFSVDGTLIEAWASLKSFKKKDASKKDEPPPDDPGNPSVDFHGEKHGNETHESTTDPNARLARKGMGKEAKLSYSAHALIENRNGLLVALQMDGADGHAERRNALEMLDECLVEEQLPLLECPPAGRFIQRLSRRRCTEEPHARAMFPRTQQDVGQERASIPAAAEVFGRRHAPHAHDFVNDSRGDG